MPEIRQILSRTMPALACVLALSSCGDDGGGTASGTSTTSRSGTPEESTTTSSTSSTTTTAPVPPAPTDGADVAACYDGSCDVEVGLPVEVPLDPAFRLGPLTFSPFGSGQVSITTVGGGGSTMNSTVGAGGSSTLNEVHIRVVAVEAQTARLILAPCAEVEGCGEMPPPP